MPTHARTNLRPAIMLACAASLACQQVRKEDSTLTKPISSQLSIVDDSQQIPADSSPKRHLLVWQDQPSTEVIVNWGVDQYERGGKHLVYYSRAPLHPESADQRNTTGLGVVAPHVHKVAASESGMAAICRDGRYANLQVKLRHLHPNTTYYYQVVSNGQSSAQLTFKTAPASVLAPVKILAGGDSRSDRQQRVAMNEGIRDLVEAEPDYLTLLHGGDFVARGWSCNDWQDWRDDHQAIIGRGGRILPLIATFGNHEVGGEGQFTALFGTPEGDDKFYFHTTLGMLELLVLNSERSVEGEQFTWLQRKLHTIANSKNPRFVTASYHRPAWPAVKRPASTAAWVPTFERYKLDLVFESDGHVLKQTCAIKEGACSEEGGVIYVGEGGLGVAQRSAVRADAWYFAQGGYAFGQHHIQSLTVEGPTEYKEATMVYEVFYDGAMHHRLELPLRARG